MDLSIRGHRLSKDGSPINSPTGEDSAGIPCYCGKKWLPIHTPQTHAITGIGKCSLFGATRHGILTDFETATSLQSSRVAFCISFRHFWKTVAQIS
jgi:hypothetical protein